MRYPDHLVAAIYTSARQEIIERIKLRDQITAGYLVVASGLLALALKDRATLSALALPYAAFCAACLTRQHQQVIGALGRYLAAEFERDLRLSESDDKGERPITHWDRSRSLLSLGEHPFKAIRSVQVVVLICPSVFALWLTFCDARTRSGASGVWVGGVLLTVFTAFQVFRARSERGAMSHDTFRSVGWLLGYPATSHDRQPYYTHFQEYEGRWEDLPEGFVDGHLKRDRLPPAAFTGRD